MILGKEKRQYTIVGVMKGLKYGTHLKASLWISKNYDTRPSDSWTSASHYNYVKLKEGVSEYDLRQAQNQIIEKSIFPVLGNGVTLDDYIKNLNSVKFYVQPLTDIYLNSNFQNEISPGGNKVNLYILFVIGVLILSMAIFNFVNFSIAQAGTRIKEISVRSTFGASRKQLIFQFIMEAELTTILAVLLGFSITYLLIVNFPTLFFTKLQIAIPDLFNDMAYIVVIGIIVGLLAGIYPAIFLARCRTIITLQSTQLHHSNNIFRKTLLTVQFLIAFVLLVGTLIINKQLTFIGGTDLGFNEENVVVIDNLFYVRPDLAVQLNERLKASGKVLSSTLHNGEPGGRGYTMADTYTTEKIKIPSTINTYMGDESFVEVFGMKIIEGRNCFPHSASDSSSVILNETAVKELQITENPIGSILNGDLVVVGVVADFHTASFREAIAPLVIRIPNEKITTTPYWSLSVREIKKAGGRQAGLYNAVKELGLDIKIIVQSWPVADYGVKTVIPFDDLEKSMTIK